MKEVNFKTIAQMHEYFGMEKPEHPHFSINISRKNSIEEATHCIKEETKISSDFYSISFKHIIGGEIFYGRTKYDFTDGALIFTSPGQSMVIKGLSVVDESIMINVHKEFLVNTEIRNRFEKYGFFSYSVNEALHLSPKEEDQIKTIMKSIHAEYENSQDEFSKDIILFQLDALLKYSDRFYKRQFLNRKEMNGVLYDRFFGIISQYFASDRHETQGLPNVEILAKGLNVTPRYLSDALKVETGKTAMDHIHLFIIDKAKDLLLGAGMTVQEVAFQLGFDYPQYFSRLFKRKVGVSPLQYQKDNSA